VSATFDPRPNPRSLKEPEHLPKGATPVTLEQILAQLAERIRRLEHPSTLSVGLWLI